MQSRVEKLWTALCVVLGTGLGLGMAPFAPGTFGSLLGPVAVWGLQKALADPVAYYVAAGLFILAGGPICGRAAAWFKSKDPGHVVYDEIAAFFLVFLWTPVTWTTAIAGFLWFRLFDILKPWPVKSLERLPGGWGILADDLAAGLYAAAALELTLRLLPQ